ncbi:MAG: efflux RND transporter periplasmic adaptor subunit [Aquisalinus sp.]|nr:efflux RND transporter periplasmic adaptor subunit [Aquisalinus sp.]
MRKLISSKLFWGIAILGALVTGFFAFASPSQTATEEPAYITVELDRGSIKRSVATSGTVQPLVRVEVGSQLSGQLIEVLADFNTEVRQGDLLARIDPDTFRSRVEEAEAQLKISRAGLAVARANQRRAEANLTQRRSDLARFEPLLEYDAISEIEVDAAQAQFDAAVADYQSSEAQVENALALVSQREASLRQAQVDLQRTDIRAPINGVVILRNVDVGQTVAASLQAPVLFEIAQDLSKIQIEADVNEADIGSVKEGNEVTFSVDAYPNREFNGVVRQVRLAPKEESNIISYTVIVNADNPQKILYPGMTASVEIITGQRDDVLRVANSVLRFKPDNADAGTSGGRSRGAGGGADRMAELQEQLGLSDEQSREIRQKMRDLFTNRGQGGPSGGGNPRDAMSKIFRTVLDEEQWEKYQALQNDRQEYTRGTLWTLDASGNPDAVPVRLGISDASHTEVVSDDLEAGSVVIQRQGRS